MSLLSPATKNTYIFFGLEWAIYTGLLLYLHMVWVLYGFRHVGTVAQSWQTTLFLEGLFHIFTFNP